MKLRFIGTDYSMGLRHGEVYNVSMKSSDLYIVLFIRKSFLHGIECPYSSPQAFAKNWRLP